MKSNNFVINVHKKNNIKSEVVTQLLYGDTFKKIKKKGSWIKIKNDIDNYKGFIKNKTFPSNQKNTHKICKLYADLYVKPNLKSKIKKKISFGSKVKIIEKKGSFYKFDNLWIKKNNLKKINYKTKVIISIFAGRMADVGKDPLPQIINSLKFAKKFKNVEILWASVREPYNYLQAKQLGCHIITIPPTVIEKIEKFGKSFNQLTIETVKAFLVDSKKSNFKI